MLVVPLVTMILAHMFLPNNALNRFNIIGFYGYFWGFYLFWTFSPNSINTYFICDFVGIRSHYFYSINSVIVEKLPNYDPLVAATCSTTIACFLAFLLWPEIIYLSLDGISTKATFSIACSSVYFQQD